MQSTANALNGPKLADVLVAAHWCYCLFSTVQYIWAREQLKTRNSADRWNIARDNVTAFLHENKWKIERVRWTIRNISYRYKFYEEEIFLAFFKSNGLITEYASSIYLSSLSNEKVWNRNFLIVQHYSNRDISMLEYRRYKKRVSYVLMHQLILWKIIFATNSYTFPTDTAWLEKWKSINADSNGCAEKLQTALLRYIYVSICFWMSLLVWLVPFWSVFVYMPFFCLFWLRCECA